MKRLSLTNYAIITAAVCILALSGCAGVPEQVLASSYQTADLFLKVEHDNRDYYREHVPELHHFAEELRRDFPTTWRTAYSAVGIWRQTKSAAAKGEMDAAIANVQTLASAAREYLRKHYREKR